MFTFAEGLEDTLHKRTLHKRLFNHHDGCAGEALLPEMRRAYMYGGHSTGEPTGRGEEDCK